MGNLTGVSRYCGAQDTFYVGTSKGVGRIYQPTFIDTYSKVSIAKLYDRRLRLQLPICSNDWVLAFFEEHEIAKSSDQWDLGTLHKTVLNELYRVAFRKKIYKTLDELQADLDAGLKLYN